MPEADERWTAALDAVGATRGDRDGAFAELIAIHDEGERHYHVFEHAAGVVDHVLALHETGDDWAPAVLAAWFHDCVYDATAPPGANEGRSAVVACRTLTGLGASLTSVGEVARLICLTAGHCPAEGDRTGALLCDADLATLAGDGETYDRYAAFIRDEFAHVPDADWTAGRRLVLRSFLDRPTIFHTMAGREQWESRARINISTELSRLT